MKINKATECHPGLASLSNPKGSSASKVVQKSKRLEAGGAESVIELKGSCLRQITRNKASSESDQVLNTERWHESGTVNGSVAKHETEHGTDTGQPADTVSEIKIEADAIPALRSVSVVCQRLRDCDIEEISNGLKDNQRTSNTVRFLSWSGEISGDTTSTGTSKTDHADKDEFPSLNCVKHGDSNRDGEQSTRAKSDSSITESLNTEDKRTLNSSASSSSDPHMQKCLLCGYTTFFVKGLDRHLKVKHGMSLITYRRKGSASSSSEPHILSLGSGLSEVKFETCTGNSMATEVSEHAGGKDRSEEATVENAGTEESVGMFAGHVDHEGSELSKSHRDAVISEDKVSPARNVLANEKGVKKPQAQGRKYSCSLCTDAAAWSLAAYKQHLSSAHKSHPGFSEEMDRLEPAGVKRNNKPDIEPAVVLITCPRCFKEFRGSRIIRHVRMSHESDPDFVSLLDMVRKDYYHKRYTLCTKGKGGLKVCPHCGLELERAAMYTHVRLHCKMNKERKKTFACSICGFRSVYQDTVDEHKASCPYRSTDGGSNFVCDTCGSGFQTKSGMMLHCRRIHHTVWNKPLKWHQCKQCDRAFHSKHHLDRHSVVHTGKGWDPLWA